MLRFPGVWFLWFLDVEDDSGFTADYPQMAPEGHYSVKGLLCQEIYRDSKANGVCSCARSLAVPESGHALELLAMTEV